MSFVVAFCHFCDIHGPSVLLSCQAVHQTAAELNPSAGTATAVCNIPPTCKACEMPHVFRSTDKTTQIRYLSCRLPWQQPQLCAWLQHICVRSLSCEVNPCVFSEPTNSALSISFSVRDAMARGFYRWFSIVISTRDLQLLVASWPFLNKATQFIITHIQDKATQVYNVERPQRFNSPPQSRSLIHLTRSKNIFARLHCWFSWLIKAATNRLTERIPCSPYYKLEPQMVFEQGNLRSLRVFLGPQLFELAALSLLEGRQVIIRGDIPALVEATVDTLKCLVPNDWCKAVSNSNEYLEPNNSQLLGVATHVAVPRPCDDIVRVDIVHGMVHPKTSAVLPQRCPTLFVKILKALESEHLRDKALAYHLLALRLEWFNIAKLVHRTQCNNAAGLLMALGVQEQDHSLLNFWTKNVNIS